MCKRRGLFADVPVSCVFAQMSASTKSASNSIEVSDLLRAAAKRTFGSKTPRMGRDPGDGSPFSCSKQRASRRNVMEHWPRRDAPPSAVAMTFAMGMGWTAFARPEGITACASGSVLACARRRPKREERQGLSQRRGTGENGRNGLVRTPERLAT
jgi:hypothetical protein